MQSSSHFVKTSRKQQYNFDEWNERNVNSKRVKRKHDRSSREAKHTLEAYQDASY